MSVPRATHTQGAHTVPTLSAPPSPTAISINTASCIVSRSLLTHTILITPSLSFHFTDVGPYQRAVRTQEHELEDLLEFFVAAPNQALPVDLDPSAELSQISLRAAAGGIRGKVPPVVVFSKA